MFEDVLMVKPSNHTKLELIGRLGYRGKKKKTKNKKPAGPSYSLRDPGGWDPHPMTKLACIYLRMC